MTEQQRNDAFNLVDALFKLSIPRRVYWVLAYRYETTDQRKFDENYSTITDDDARAEIDALNELIATLRRDDAHARNVRENLDILGQNEGLAIITQGSPFIIQCLADDSASNPDFWLSEINGDALEITDFEREHANDDEQRLELYVGAYNYAEFCEDKHEYFDKFGYGADIMSEHPGKYWTTQDGRLWEIVEA